MTSEMQHKGQAVAGLSGGVWGNLPVKNWSIGLGGQFHFQSATGMETEDDGTAWANNSYGKGMKAELGTNSTIVVAQDVSKSHNASVIQLTNDGGDGIDCGLGTRWTVVNIASGAGRWAFEARIHPSSIADTQLSSFVGLSGTLIDGNTTVSAGDLTDSNICGFFIDEADGDDVRAVLNDATGTSTAGLANMDSVSADNKYVLGSADFYNVGAVYDGSRIKFYISGIKSGETVAKSVLLHSVGEGETGFPGTTDMDMYFEMSAECGPTGSGVGNLGIEWFAYGQEFTDF
jgi:hypothetical protein